MYEHSKAHGDEVTRVFYSHLLVANSSLKGIFNKSNQFHLHPSRVNTAAPYAYASHIDDLNPLNSAVEPIANKYARLYVHSKHYVVVGKYLLVTMQDGGLDDAITTELLEARALHRATRGLLDKERR